MYIYIYIYISWGNVEKPASSLGKPKIPKLEAVALLDTLLAPRLGSSGSLEFP